MCTAVTYAAKDHYFGRTFDWEVSYGEMIAFTPRNYPFSFRRMSVMKSHYAMLGIAVVTENYPLYYDAINEAGLGMAGLNFPNNTDYKEPAEDKDNIAPFEFIPWILGQCATVQEARRKLERINLAKIPFGERYPLSPLHWIIADKKEAITVECVKEGLKVYDNPVGVLTNNPPFDMQLFYLSNFMQLSKSEPVNYLGEELKLVPYSRGMGAMGLPGDWSSASRFVRAVFTKVNSLSEGSEEECVSQFFRILGSVEQIRGCVRLESRKDGQDVYEISIYTTCCNLDKGMYYYKTYNNSSVSCVDMYQEDMDGAELVVYELNRKPEFVRQN